MLYQYLNFLNYIQELVFLECKSDFGNTHQNNFDILRGQGTFKQKWLIGPNPTDRGKLARNKTSSCIDWGQGIPLSVVVITAANMHNDIKGSYKHAG
jgi:hypothetical protein